MCVCITKEKKPSCEKVVIFLKSMSRNTSKLNSFIITEGISQICFVSRAYAASKILIAV